MVVIFHLANKKKSYSINTICIFIAAIGNKKDCVRALLKHGLIVRNYQYSFLDIIHKHDMTFVIVNYRFE